MLFFYLKLPVTICSLLYRYYYKFDRFSCFSVCSLNLDLDFYLDLGIVGVL